MQRQVAGRKLPHLGGPLGWILTPCCRSQVRVVLQWECAGSLRRHALGRRERGASRRGRVGAAVGCCEYRSYDAGARGLQGGVVLASRCAQDPM